MSPEYVRPYVKSNKNDDLDAEAIAEAASGPTMRFVLVKSGEQSDVQALHRARERLVNERTALIHHLWALLLERGIVTPQGRRKLEAFLETFADEDATGTLSLLVCTPFDRTPGGLGYALRRMNSRGDRNFRPECGWTSQ